MDVVQFIQTNAQAVLDAPLAFLLFAALVFFGAERFARSRYEDRIKLRDDQIADWKRKTEGNTPDDARARLDALEGQVREILPRRLTPEQRGKLSEALARRTGKVSVCLDMGVAEARQFSQEIALAFKNAGWDVQQPQVMGPSNPPPAGIGLRVENPAALTPLQSDVADALRAVGLRFDVQAERPNPHMPSDATILITSKIH